MMLRRSAYQLALLILAGAQAVAAQDVAAADVTTLDGIIRAYYEVVSGPVGTPADRQRDRSLHHPSAVVAVTGADAGGTPFIQAMTLEEFHDRFGGPRTAPFYEWEIHRETQRFGNVAHVWSTYVSSDAPDGPPRERGINSIQLYFDGDRWWITGWIFDSERAGNPIPVDYLPH